MTSHNERVVGIDEEKGDVIDHIDYVAHRKDHHHLADDAAEILEQAGDPIEITEQDRKRVLRKIDFWVAVPLCIVYTIYACPSCLWLVTLSNGQSPPSRALHCPQGLGSLLGQSETHIQNHLTVRTRREMFLELLQEVVGGSLREPSSGQHKGVKC